MTAALSHSDQRQELLNAAQLLMASGVMSSTGHINFSVRVGPDDMLLTSRGLVQDLTLDTLAVVGLDGRVGDGHLDASTSEIVVMHTAVYRRRGEAGAVVHTHSPHVTAFALAGRPLPCRYEALVRRGQRQAVPVVAWAPRGSAAFGSGIDHALVEHPGTQVLLLGNHGLLAFGASPVVAAKLVVTLEEAAAAEIRAIALGGAQDLPDGRAGTDGRAEHG